MARYIECHGGHDLCGIWGESFIPNLSAEPLLLLSTEKIKFSSRHVFASMTKFFNRRRSWKMKFQICGKWCKILNDFTMMLDILSSAMRFLLNFSSFSFYSHHYHNEMFLLQSGGYDACQASFEAMLRSWSV